MATFSKFQGKEHLAALSGFLFAFGVSATQPGTAADFSQAQKIFVPASSIPRNGGSLRVHTADNSGLNRYVGDLGPASGNPYPASSPPSSSGLVPPPPPTTPILSGNTLVPGTASAATAGKGASSKSGSGKLSSKSTAKTAGGISSPTAAARAKAQELIKAGKLDEAESLLKDTYRSWPKDSLVSNDLVNLDIDRAEKFLSTNDYENALKATREAVYVNPSSIAASALLDQIHKQRGVDPNDAGDRVKIADLLAAQGRTTAATVEYRAALKIKPYAAAHVGLGNLAVRNGNKTLAKQEYQTALEIDPNSALAHRQMGILRLNNGDKVGANSDLSRAVILDPSDKIAGKQLIELWQRQVAVAPGEASGHMGLARAYQLTGDLNAAQAEYRTVVKLDPDNPNLPAARQSFKLALARQQAEKASQAAHTLESQGAIQEANQKITEALGYCPTDAGYRIYQGQLLEKLGQIDPARQAYLAVLREDPKNVTAAQRLKALSPYSQQGYQGYYAPPAQQQPVGLKATMAPPLALPSSNMPSSSTAAAATATAGLAAFAGGTASGIPLTEAPPLPTLPTPTANDPVSNLSNFLISLRDHTLSQKQQVQAYESATHSALNNTAQQNLASSLGLGSLLPGASTSGAAATSTAGSLAAGLAGTPASSAAVTPAQALASAAAALGLPTGNLLGSSSTAPAGAAASPAMTASVQPPAASAADLQAAVQRLNTLEQQNQTLASQLQQAQLRIQDLQSAPPPAYPAAGYPIAAAAGYGGAVTGLSAGGAPLAVSYPMPAGTSELPPPSPEPGLRPPLPSGRSPQSSLLAPEQTNGSPVSFELIGFTPSKSSVQLKVVLKNSQDTSFKLPAAMRAIIRNSGKPDITVKPSFKGSSVPAHGELQGVVTVPAKQLDPASDLVIPDLLPSEMGQRDVHLISRVSSL